MRTLTLLIALALIAVAPLTAQAIDVCMGGSRHSHLAWGTSDPSTTGFIVEVDLDSAGWMEVWSGTETETSCDYTIPDEVTHVDFQIIPMNGQCEANPWVFAGEDGVTYVPDPSPLDFATLAIIP